jgi:putative ABC transport system permease protein
MDLGAILSTLRRNAAGALLIALQVAVTVAVVCNALAIIGERRAHMGRDSGLDEPNLFTLRNQWPGGTEDPASRIAADMQALRALPQVRDAVVTNAFPLRGWAIPGASRVTLRTSTSRRSR